MLLMGLADHEDSVILEQSKINAMRAKPVARCKLLVQTLEESPNLVLFAI